MENLKEVEEFILYLNKMRGLSDRTIKDYMDYFIKFDVESISQEYINNFLKRYKNISIVRAMIKNYLEFKEMTRDFILPAPRHQKARKLIRPIDDKEIKDLSEYLHNKAYKNGLAFDLIYQGALRRSEILTIKIHSFQWSEWIDDGAKDLIVLRVIGKGSKEREVLINGDTAKMILEKLNEKFNPNDEQQFLEMLRSDMLLFKGMNEQNIYDMIHRGSLKCLGRDIRPHELRHHRATELESLGNDIKDIKNYLGHSSIATTEIYLHSNSKESIKNIRRVLSR